MTSLSHSPALIPGFGFARTRDKAFAAVRKLWKLRQSQGMSQLDLAARLGRDPAWVSRKLAGPSNWTLRTLGDLADALDGEVEIQLIDLNAPPSLRNYDAYTGYGDDVVFERRIERAPETSSDALTLKLELVP
jgi:transcriptional regulator with XRE-family HTH domain